jgi:hypothetical protein
MEDDAKIDMVGRILAVVFSPLLVVAYIGYWLFSILPEYGRTLLAYKLAGDIAVGSNGIPDDLPSNDHHHGHSGHGFDSGGHGFDAGGHY